MQEMEDELERLLIEHESGTLDNSGYERLRTMLKQDADARERYLQWQLVSVALTDDAADLPWHEISQSSLSVVNEDNRVRTEIALKNSGGSSSKWIIGLTLAILLLMVAIPWWPSSDQEKQNESLAQKSNSEQESSVEQTSEGVAILTRTIDVKWGDEASKIEAGEAIKPGMFSIVQGLAQVELFSGATLVIEGPAEIEFKSANLAKVKNGKLRANVPEVAKGFTLEVEGAKVVDLGTEFGLMVDEDRLDVQVFQGLVEVHPDEGTQNSTAETKTIHAGGGITRLANGDIRAADIQPEKFLSLSELESRQNLQIKQRAKRWRDWSETIRQDDRVIAYYSFDRPESWYRKLRCDSSEAEDEKEGAIIGARRVSGRWQSKGGLEFKRPGDRVRMKIPGEFDSLSFSAWVKIDSLDRMYNSLFLTDNYNQGEPHWQILESGQLFFSVRWRSDEWVRGKSPDGKAHHPVISPKFWKPSLSGKWIHLVTTFDVSQSLVSHYLNGELIHAERIPQELMVNKTRIGEATMGNWSIPTRPDSKFAIRNLNGTIDEMLILKTALTQNEVKQIYLAGKP